MQILVFDDSAHEQIILAFLRDFCPEERKAEVEALLAEKNWAALDQIMIPFHNIE